MQWANGKRSYNLFVGEFTHALDSKGRLTIPSKWRIPGGDNTYLTLPNPGGYVTVYPPKMVARLEEKVAEASLSDVRAGIINGIIRKSTFLWLRQAGPDKSERQIKRARRNKGEGRARGKFFSFCNMVGNSLREASKWRPKKYFRCDEGVGVVMLFQPDWVTLGGLPKKGNG